MCFFLLPFLINEARMTRELIIGATCYLKLKIFGNLTQMMRSTINIGISNPLIFIIIYRLSLLWSEDNCFKKFSANVAYQASTYPAISSFSN